MAGLVNGQAQSLTTVNQDRTSSKSDLKDSIRDNKAAVSEFVELMLRTGGDGSIGSNLAPVIGLPKAMPMKAQEIILSQRNKDIEKRACYVIYENIESTAAEAAGKKAVCAYIVKIKRTGLDKQMRYFRIDLNGKLEKVILSQSKLDDAGNVVLGSGVKTDQDIDSPEVKKTFEAEMKFWLKDWLKKEQKASAKKSA